MITHRPGHLAPPVDPVATAVPPLDEDLEEMFAELAGGGPSLGKVLAGLREIALTRHDVDGTQTQLLSLAGAEPNVVDLIARIVARLGDSTTNPALRELTDTQQTRLQKLTSAYAHLTDHHQLSALVSETGLVIQGDDDSDDATLACWFCGADNSPSARACGFCHHRTEDGPSTT
ncbi:hypothetical protein ACH4TX_41720 [Streptomyces sp. NPDC021098]|uniref:hypothetical protein n=1 Tax=unclassified Streptomyces TaxID=2593676 RepID=UPI003795763B